jgi:MiaB/RimO family radical SAM methylthiotransferase
MKQVYIDANGCEEARLDAQKLKNLLAGTNYICTNDARLADIIVFYACGHLQGNENESLSIIRTMIRLKKKSAMLVVWGCLTEINPEAIERIYKGSMVGPEHWDFFCDLFHQSRERMQHVHSNILNTGNKQTKPHLMSALGLLNILRYAFDYEQRKTWYIKVESGCTEKCTYCSDRLAFKCVSSEPIDAIISQFELGLESGFKHFYLVGRDLGSYGHDLGSDLPTLLNKMLENHVDQDYSLSLCNMSPRSLIQFYPKLRNILSSGKISQVGSHIQSGSNRILELMGRKSSIHEWLKVIKDIKENYPDIRLTTSIIVGFPTETEQDFSKSMDLLDIISFDEIDVYKYEERPNLPSLRLRGRVSSKVKEARSNRMRRKVISNNIKMKIERVQIIPLIQSLISYAIQFDVKHGLQRDPRC